MAQELKLELECNDENLAEEIRSSVQDGFEERPEQVERLLVEEGIGSLDAIDPKFVELALVFAAGVGSGMTSQLGKELAVGILWVARKIWERICAAQRQADAPSVKLKLKLNGTTHSIRLSANTSSDELDAFVKAIKATRE